MLASQRDDGSTFNLLDCHSSWVGQGILQYRGLKTTLVATASPAQSSPIIPPGATATGWGSRRRRQPTPPSAVRLAQPGLRRLVLVRLEHPVLARGDPAEGADRVAHPVLVSDQ